VLAAFEGIVDRFISSSSAFGQKLAAVHPGQWSWPTPCAEWNVRQLVNHMTQGNLNYVRLLDGATSGEFLRLRDADALGADPPGAYARFMRECAAAFARPGALEQVLDYPLGQITGQQALAVRATDTIIHTWDLAQAIGVDDTLSPGLVAWVSDHLDEIYDDLAETPADPQTTHRFFAPPEKPAASASQQYRLLHRMGRRPPMPPDGHGRGPRSTPVQDYPDPLLAPALATVFAPGSPLRRDSGGPSVEPQEFHLASVVGCAHGIEDELRRQTHADR
jgi:uncharacterized protein (TIGR03086 family)